MLRNIIVLFIGTNLLVLRPSLAQDVNESYDNELVQAALQPVGTLNVPNSTIELGELMQGSSVDVRFPYEVSGQGPVKILGLHEDCGCLSTSLRPGQYLPERSRGEIKVTLDTKSFSGPVDKSILLMTDGSKANRMARLRIRAKIRPMVSLNPPLVRFDFSQDKTQEVVVALAKLSSQTLNIEKVDFNKDNLDVDVEPVRDMWQVRVKWKGQVPVQPFQEIIRISASPPYGNLQIPVLGHVGAKR